MTRLPHTWCNVHIETPLHHEQVPDEHADVFEAVARAEEHSLNYFNLNLIGKLVNTNETPMAQALTAAGIRVHTRNVYGDPIEIIGKHLPDISRDYHARVLASMAWRADTAVINAARGLFYALYAESERAEEVSNSEHFEAFVHDVADAVRQSSLWSSDIAKPEAEQLAILMRVRLAWHEAAMSAANAADRDYNPKTIGEMLVEEKPAKLSITARANYEVAAKRSANGDPIKFEQRMRQFEKMHEMRGADQVQRNKRLIHVVEVVLAEADMQMAHNGRFDQLDKRTQRSLVDFAMQTLERIAEQDMAKDRKVSAQMYGRILDAQDDAVKELREYRDANCDEGDELENARSGQPANVMDRLRSFTAPVNHKPNEQQQRDQAKAAGREHVEGVTGA